MTAVVELFYSVRELSFLLRFSESTIRRRIRDGDFSPPGEDGAPDLANILDVDGDLRIPASGVIFFQRQHALVWNAGVKARNLGELRRKLRSPSRSPDV